MEKQLKGKNVLITGCLSGIGRATLDLFANEGANAIWACCQNETDEFIEYIVALSKETGAIIRPLYFDLASSEQIKAELKKVIASKEKIDVLVNIAGVTQNSLFQMTSIDSMKNLFELDFFSQMLITQIISKIMIRNKCGSIINISSITATDGNAGQVSYSAAKAALIGASKTLSIELGTSNIRVNVVSPGVIETGMTKSLESEKLDKLLYNCKLGRIGLPSEVSNLLIFLASDMSSYITGQNIRIDGGIGG